MSAHGVEQPLTILLVERLDVDHLEIDALGEVTVRVIDIRDPARHARPEVPPRRTEDHHPSTGHVLASVVADTLNHRGDTGVADAEALSDLAPYVALPRGRPVEDDVAGDDLLLGREGRRLVGAHHDAATRQSL